MSKVGKWETSAKPKYFRMESGPLGQLIHHFPIQSILYLLHHLFIHKGSGTLCLQIAS